jgi:hypothetical protein
MKLSKRYASTTGEEALDALHRICHASTATGHVCEETEANAPSPCSMNR